MSDSELAAPAGSGVGFVGFRVLAHGEKIQDGDKTLWPGGDLIPVPRHLHGMDVLPGPVVIRPNDSAKEGKG